MRAPWIGLAVAVVAAPAGAQQPVAAATEASVREWSGRVDRLLASRGLALRLAREDTMIAGRRHERLGQLYEGVPVFGGELARQSDASGPLTVFGTLYEGIELDVAPRLRAQDAERAAAARGGHPFGTRGGPQLVVLPLDAGGYRLAYRVRAAFAPGFDLRQLFFDANTGELLLDYRDLQTQAAGLATGVLGDQKKISVTASGARR
ncbi:MAG: hypothetical protein ACM3PV_10370 [Betaproteobacteria bacterium]